MSHKLINLGPNHSSSLTTQKHLLLGGAFLSRSHKLDGPITEEERIPLFMYDGIMKNVYFICGVNGVGKTAVIPELRLFLSEKDFIIHDFDERGVS